MKLLRLIVIPVLLLLIARFSDAQDFKEDINKANSFYANQVDFQMEVDVKIFKELKGTVPTISKHASIKKHGDFFTYRLDNIELLMTTKELVMVNHSEKSIFYRTITAKERKALSAQYQMYQVDSLIQRYDSINYVGAINGDKKYIIHTTLQGMNKMEIAFQEENFYIKSIKYYYDIEKVKNYSRVDINFSGINLTPVYSPTQFLVSNYVIKEGKLLKPSPKYSHYKVMDVTEK